MGIVLKFISQRIQLFQALYDFLLIGLAWMSAYLLRFLFLSGAQSGLDTLFVQLFFPLVGLTVYFLLRNKLYTQKHLSSFVSEAMQVMRANTLSLLAFIVLLYFLRDGRISRLTLVFYAALSTALLVFGRAFMRSFIRKMRRRGFLVQRVLVVGDGEQIERYLKAVRYLPGTGLFVDAVFGSKSQVNGERTLELSELDLALSKEKPDIVVLAFADESSSFVSSFIERYYDSLFSIQVLPAERQALIGMTTESFGEVKVLALNQPESSTAERAAKRLVDFVCSGLGLLVLSPLFAIMGVAIRISSEGPIFFGQERIGLNGEQFKMWKFRSMRLARENESSTGWTVENDPRRTKIGTFLRRTSIDELPQLWNVFVGQMSLVGPRPEQPFYVEKFRKEIPAYMLRHKMRAGITGWAQVNGWRGDTSLVKRIECDLYYIRNWSFWFDLKILVMTFIKGFVNKNAY